MHPAAQPHILHAPGPVPGSRARGFTLLELLIALSIFALVAVMAYNGLYVVLNARAQTDAQAQRLAEIQTALTMVGRDIEQTLARDIRDEFGDIQPPLRGGAQDGALLEFTHAGWRNPAGQPRSDLQRVAYRIVEDSLMRMSWGVLDRAQDSTPLESPLLEKVTDAQVRFMDDQNAWLEQWPPANPVTQPNPSGTAPNPLPRAVELQLVLQDFGRIVRLFALPEGYVRIVPTQNIAPGTGAN